MLTALLAFCAGVLATFATVRSAMRRFIIREAVEQRWQAFVDAAGYDRPIVTRARPARGGREPAVRGQAQGGTTYRPAATTPRRPIPRLTPHEPMSVTIRVKQ